MKALLKSRLVPWLLLLLLVAGGATTITIIASDSEKLAGVTPTTAGLDLLDDAAAANQRTTLGLGTIATQNSNNVSLTGGSVSGITDLAVADGGTGASTAANARTNLGLGSLATQNSDSVAITGGMLQVISISDSQADTLQITNSLISGGTIGSLADPLPVDSGGTGATTLTGLVKGNGTNAFTAATAGTDYYKSGATTSQGQIVTLVGTIGSPADATTYFAGSTAAQSGSNSFTTVAGRRRFYFPSSGTITKAYITVVNDGGTAGTSETSTLNLRLNNTADTALSSGIVTDTVTALNNTGLSVAITAGDYVELKWVAPTWVTNPTNVIIIAQLEFHP